jgi:predicted RNA-binding Zn-ribbon protein involved in translation (DUF1610 family)
MSGKFTKPCPKCGYQPDRGGVAAEDHHAVNMAKDHRQQHPMVVAALGAVYLIKRAGLMPAECPKCGKYYWRGPDAAGA